MSAEHVVVRLSNSQVALLASALNPTPPDVRTRRPFETDVLGRAEMYERWLCRRQASTTGAAVDLGEGTTDGE